MEHNLLAVDLGAESGRAILGTLTSKKLVCREVHRFPNGGVRVFDHLYWDVLRLFAEIKAGIAKAAAEAPGSLSGIGIDSWAVDFGLLGRSGELLGGVHHYRDPRTDGVMEQVFARAPKEEIYRLTGVQFLPFNTIFQLAALKASEPGLLPLADSLLMVGELITYFLTGERVAEFTNASTTQLLEPRTMTWSQRLLDAIEVPRELMPQIVQPGTRVGALLNAVANETGAGSVPVLVPAVHDTGSAVAAVPAEGENWAYISSGTWSLVGLERSEPLITDESFALNISNEGGVAGTFRVLKNVMGLWLLQECRRAWAREGACEDYEGLVQLAEAAPPLQAHFDPDDPSLLQPGNMPERIAALMRARGIPVPATRGAFVRCILESLALKYRYVLEQLQQASGAPSARGVTGVTGALGEMNVTGTTVEVIHIVGGGARNRLLNQMTADATGCVVVAGPYEATAVGNLMVQGIGLGLIDNVQSGRALVRRSFDLEVFQPQERPAWDAAYARFKEQIEGR